jgi:hypothetical protein
MSAASVVASLAVTAMLVSLLAACASFSSPEGEENEAHADQSYTALQETYEASRAERGRAAADCLAENGFPGAVVGTDGSTNIDVPEGQQTAYEQAAVDCMKTVCPNCGAPLPQDSLERLYALQVEARACLQSFDIDTSEPPALQTYLDTPEADRWNPHLEAGPLVAQSGRSVEIEKDCPDPVSMASYW